MEEKIGFNMAVDVFREKIIKTINENGLPAAVTMLVLESVMRKFEPEVERVTQAEIQEYNERKEKKHDGTSNNSERVDKQAVNDNTAGADQT